MLNNWINKYKWEKIFPYIVIIIGLVQGLIYVFLIPPWQHYDEPGHFEYAWMIANHDSFPQKGEYDNEVRLEILESMKRNDFFNSPSLQKLSTVAHTYDPVWIGITQVGDPPLYYVLTAVPLWVLKNASVEVQLYASRIISLILFLSVIFYAEKFAKEIDPKKKYFYYLFPISLVLVPAFVEHSVAMNNDVLATLVYSIILVYGIRTIKDGINLKRLFFLFLLIGVSLLTKASVWLSVIVVPLVLYFSWFQKKKPLKGSFILVFIALAGIFLFFELKDAAYWLPTSNQSLPTKTNTQYGTALQISSQPETNSLSHFITDGRQETNEVAGKVVTIGAWIWSDIDKTTIGAPYLNYVKDKQDFYLTNGSIEITNKPTFFAFHHNIPENFDFLYLVFEPVSTDENLQNVYYQNPLFVIGEFPGNIEPNFDVGKNSGEWNREGVTNLVRDHDLKKTWPRFRPFILELFNKIDYRISRAASWIIYSLDTKATFWYTQESFENLFRSFWGKFAWSQVVLSGNKPFRPIKIFSLIGLILSLFYLIPKLSKKNVNIFFWLAIAIFGNLFYAWFTGISDNSFFGKPQLPDSRYIFVSIYPLLGLIVYGWSSILAHVQKRFRIGLISLYFVFFAYININAIYTIVQFYY
ncbi:MAG: hypothetical protein CL609_09215 [Anaerolineaceae bacterium]|nr:hypothetical protein [Anaerolineaceae bacterium]